MLTMRLTLVLVLFLAACGTDTSTDDVTTGSTGLETSDTVYAASLAESACDLLTADQAATILEVPVGDLEHMDAAGACQFSTDDRKRASVHSIDVFDTAAEAEAAFLDRYRALTQEEADQASQAMAEQVDAQREAGEIDAETAEQASAMGGAFAQMATGTQYEPVEGVGDRAVYDGTARETSLMRTVTSKLIVLDGNLIFQTTGDFFVGATPEAKKAGPFGADIERNREAAIAVARAVLENAR